MSGGEYDYAYRGLEDMAERLIWSGNPLRVAFGYHLILVAAAMHDIEWVDSGDYSKGDEVAAIKVALGEHWDKLTIKSALSQIDGIKHTLQELLEGK